MVTKKTLAVMTSKRSEIDLSPLDQIRQTEAEVIRRIAAAHQAAEQIIGDARQEAARIKKQAGDVGHLEGQARFKEIVSKAEVEAQALIIQAQQQAEELRRRGDQNMDRAVVQVVQIILGLEGDR